MGEIKKEIHHIEIDYPGRHDLYIPYFVPMFI